MTEEQIEWLNQISKGADEKKTQDARRERQAALLAQIHQEMDELAKQAPGKGFDQTAVGGKTKILGRQKKRKFINPHGDQVEEHDTDDGQQGYGLVETEKEKDDTKRAKKQELLTEKWNEVSGADAKVRELMERLEKEEYDDVDEHGNPVKRKLFEEEDIAEELYTPLVRQRIMPDNMVPNRFSRTQDMIDETFEAYGERVGENDSEKNTFWKRVGADFVGGDSVLANFAETALGAPVELNEDSSLAAKNLPGVNSDMKLDFLKGKDGDPEKLGCVFELSGMVAIADMGLLLGKEGFELGSKAAKKIQEYRKKREEKREAVDPRQLAILARMATIAIGEELCAGVKKAAVGHDKEAAQIKTLYISKVDSGQLAKQLLLEETEEAIGRLADGFPAALTACDAANTPMFGKIGPPLQTAFKAAAKADVIEKAFASKGALGGALDHLRRAARLAARAALQIAADPNDDEEQKELAKKLGANNALADLQTALNDPGAQQTLTDNARQQMEDDFFEAFGDPKKEVQQELEAIQNEKDKGKRDSLIDAKIKEWQAINKTMELAVELVSGGMEAVIRFVPVLGPINNAVKFIANLARAAMRGRDLKIWFEAKVDFLKDSSPYASAAQNMFNSQAMHTAHYGFNAAMECGKMIAGAVKCSGFGTAAGEIAHVVLDAATTIEGLLYKVAKEGQLRRGWNKYKKALQRPQNRRLALKAIKNNATLAKYSIAYGAFVAGDDLAVAVAGRCGLDADTLQESKKTANIHLVVEYFEARFADDVVVLKKQKTVVNWAPPVELTARCWARCKAAGENKAKLKPQATGPIEQLLSRIEAWENGGLEEKVSDIQQNTLANQQLAAFDKLFGEVAEAFGVLRNNLLGYLPLNTEDKPHSDMQAVRDRFLKEVDESADAIDGMRKEWEEEDANLATKPTWTAPEVKLTEAAWKRLVAAARKDAKWADGGAADPIADELPSVETVEFSLDARKAHNELDQKTFDDSKDLLNGLTLKLQNLPTDDDQGDSIPALVGAIDAMKDLLSVKLQAVLQRETEWVNNQAATGWFPNPLELSAACWNLALQGAANAGLDAQKSKGAQAVANALAQAIAVPPAPNTPQDYDPQPYQDVRDNVFALKEALMGFKPINHADGKKHAAAADLAQRFVTMANLRIQVVNTEEKQHAPAV